MNGERRGSDAQAPSCAHVSDARSASPPAHLCCPISKDIFERPVMIRETGHTYDEANLREWLTVCNASPTCPLTRKPIHPGTVFTLNEELYEQVQAWKREHGNSPRDADVSHRSAVPAGDTDSAATSPAQLVHALSRSTRHSKRISMLQRLQEFAWHSEADKMQIAQAGGIATLLDLVIPTTGKMHMETQWHAAEVLSLLALVDQLRDDILTAVVQRNDNNRQLDAGLRMQLDALIHPKAPSTNPHALWTLWLLSLGASLRSRALTEPQLIPVLVSALHRRDASSFAALRVVRSLALVDTNGVLHTGGVVGAIVSLLANTNLASRGGVFAPRPASTQRIVAMAACSALCNTTSRHHGAPADAASRAGALRCVQAMLRAEDSPHVQGWAARFVRMVGATWTNGWQLCKDAGVLPPLLLMLQGPLDMTKVTACSAMHALAEVAPQARADMARDGAVELLAAAVQSRHYPLRIMAARTMAELACPAASGAFHCTPVGAAMEHLLQDSCEHCQYCAAVALLNTSTAAHPGASCLVLQHVDAATLRGLLRLLSSSSSHYRCSAAAVLRQLVRVEGNRPSMVKVGAVHALLEVVVRDAGRSPLEAAGALQHLARMGSFYRNAVVDAAQAVGKVPKGMLDGLVGQLYTSRSS